MGRQYSTRNVLAGAAVAIVIAALLWRPISLHLKALALLESLSGEPVSFGLQQIAGRPVHERDLTVTTKSGVLRARIYAPGTPSNLPGLVVFHGVHHLGID